MFNIFKKLMGGMGEEERKIKYKDFFMTPLGQEILIDLKRESYMYTSQFPREDTMFIEGKRSMVYYILDILYNQDKEEYILKEKQINNQ